jgi:hypothetical protein
MRKLIAVALLFAAACSPLPPPAFDREEEGFAIRALIAKNPKDQIDADHARMRIVRSLDIADSGVTAHVEGDYVEAPKTGQQSVSSPQGKFVIEAKKADGKWAIVSDELKAPPPSAAP